MQIYHVTTPQKRRFSGQLLSLRIAEYGVSLTDYHTRTYILVVSKGEAVRPGLLVEVHQHPLLQLVLPINQVRQVRCLNELFLWRRGNTRPSQNPRRREERGKISHKRKWTDERVAVDKAGHHKSWPIERSLNLFIASIYFLAMNVLSFHRFPDLFLLPYA